MDEPNPSRRRPSLGRRLALVVLVGLAVFGLVTSCGDSEPSGGGSATGKLTVRSVRIDEPVNGRSAAVRLVIDNRTETDDTLLSVTSPEAASATLHRSEVDGEGRSTMTDLPNVAVPAGEETVFRSGGLHVMLEQFTADLEVGSEVELTLTFDKAGTRTVTGTVVPLGEADPDDGHDMGDMDHAGS